MKLILFIFSLSLVLMSRDVQAYSFTIDIEKGFYWGSLPIAIKKFAIDDAEGTQLEALTKSAEQEWENRVGREIWDIENGYEIGFPNSGNTIRWSNNFAAETGFDPSTTLAVTIRQTVGPYIAHTEIILNGHLDYLRQNWADSLRKTILHELGHTVGLGHSDHQAIMGSTISSVSALQQDDEEGMNALIDQTVHRQSIGYISPEANLDDQNALACGSVSLNNGDDGPGSGLPSLFLGAILSILLLSYKPERQFLPVS